MMGAVVVSPGARPEEAARIAEIYAAAFDRKLRPFCGGPAEAAAFLAPHLNADRALVARAGGRVVGVAGLKEGGRGLFTPGLGAFRRAFGLFGVLRGVAMAVLERAERADSLLLDGVAVDAEVRGRGVGAALLAAAEETARDLDKSWVRLDVVDTNPRARRLYERLGYDAVRTTGVGPLRLVFPFDAVTEMRKAVS